MTFELFFSLINVIFHFRFQHSFPKKQNNIINVKIEGIYKN